MEDTPFKAEDSQVDETLVRWFLSLTPSERLEVLQNYVNSFEEIRRHND
jgi:hypothetical protein